MNEYITTLRSLIADEFEGQTDVVGRGWDEIEQWDIFVLGVLAERSGSV